MKYVNKFGSVEAAVAHSGSMSPNISFVAGSANPNNLVITNVGDNKEIIFENRGGGLIEGSVKPSQIIYTATSQLTNSKYAVGASFCGSTITAHTFNSSTGEGIITFAGEITAIDNSSFNSESQDIFSIKFPNTLTSLGNYVCGKIKATSIQIPDSILSVGYYCFIMCDQLKEINIPLSLTSITKEFCQNCHSLESVTIHENVTSIGDNCFNWCGSLIVKCLPTTPPTITSLPPFQGVSKIQVPAGSVDAYKAAWTSVADKIEAIPT